ncbi:class II glutamine amidotransferase [Shimia abyssi]|uniref:Glutamine amidotransferase n=1 Tax=Shimia abyssi TaxID=1662395 RepID=A0A2P8FC48_9RHOB|nr:class II glutamine amidotransferase [Shimia abyssi]PSL19301.1 glutamine amidotransferase [Shimia abyssi]
MCRWAAYIGHPVYLEDVVTRPDHSLIQQSIQATECKTTTNADGFGVAWYGSRPEPGLYRDTYPAWSDPNLKSLTAQVKSGLFLAHVRASTGTATSRNNCHPFAVGRWSFMHNGQIGGFDAFRRRADMLIPDRLYHERKGATDSEILFLLALVEGLDETPKEAMELAVGILYRLSREWGTAPHVRIGAAFADGETLYAIRYASDHLAPTVYYRWSESRGGYAVVSEPLAHDEEDWVAVPPGSFCAFRGREVQVERFAPPM